MGNKSNSTADAVQVEANLQEQLSNHLHFRQEWAFINLGRSRFESLLAHVGLIATGKVLIQIFTCTYCSRMVAYHWGKISI